jgi:predicted Zn-dependent peptidase
MMLHPASSGSFLPLSPLPLPSVLLSNNTSGMAGLSSSSTLGPLQSALLSNGAMGHFVQMPNQTRSAISILLPTNSLAPGTDILLKDILRDGSEATRQMVSQLSNQGIRFFADRIDDYLHVGISGPVGQEAALSQWLMNFMTRPIVDPPTFNAVKSKAVKGHQGLLNDPDVMLYSALKKRIYGPGHTFSLSMPERMQTIAQQDLNTLMSRYQQMLQAVNRAKVLMVSSQPVAMQQQMLNDAIRGSGWFSQPYGSAAAAMPIPLPSPVNTQPPVLFPNNTLKRALIKTIWKAPDIRDPDYPAYHLLRAFLQGQGDGSFFQKLRTQDGLIYSFDLSEGHKLAQGNCLDFGCEVEFNKIGQALQDISLVTGNACQSMIRPAVLDTLKRKAMLDFRTRQQESRDVSNLYTTWLTCDASPPDLQQLQAALNRVTPADIQRVANRMFNPASGAFQLTGISAPASVLQQWFPGRPLASA